MKINREDLEDKILMVLHGIITDAEYRDRQDIIKIRRMDAGELFAHISISQQKDHERIIILIIGTRPRGAAPLINEVMRRFFNAELFTEYLMVDYALGIKQYVMFFNRRF